MKSNWLGARRPHARVLAPAVDDGRTRQEFRDECDINTIMAKYGRTGLLPTVDRQMNYGDFTELPDFMSAMNTVSKANEAFAALPAKVRKRFNNDPAEFCDYVSDPENIDEVRKLGLAKEVPPAAPDLPKGAEGGLPPETKPAGDKGAAAPA